MGKTLGRDKTMTLAITETNGDIFNPDAAEETVTDELSLYGFEVRAPTSEECCHLKITNVRSTVADLTVWRRGIADWEYHAYDDYPRNPTRLTAITLAVLCGNDAPANPSGTGQFAHLTDLDKIGRAAAAHGLAVTSSPQDPDDDSARTGKEIIITHPRRPRRGTVGIMDDGGLWWRCEVRHQADDPEGLDLTEIARTIARALAWAGEPDQRR